jgi:hypothetical protein
VEKQKEDSMKTYWDYSEKERSQMPEATVHGMLDIELMEKGVLKVVAPMLLPIEPVELKKMMMFQVGGILFKTAELAQKFLELEPKEEGYTYEVGYDIKHPKAIDPRIVQVEIHDEQSVLNSRQILVKNKSAKEQNDKAMEIFNKASKAMEDTLSGVWEDWHRCRGMECEHKNVIDTLETYKKMADGDAVIAEKFLEKIFTTAQIAAAKAWFGIEREVVQG